jgi:hypothetical protein
MVVLIGLGLRPWVEMRPPVMFYMLHAVSFDCLICGPVPNSDATFLPITLNRAGRATVRCVASRCRNFYAMFECAGQ